MMHSPLNVKIHINISTAHMKDTTATILQYLQKVWLNIVECVLEF